MHATNIITTPSKSLINLIHDFKKQPLHCYFKVFQGAITIKTVISRQLKIVSVTVTAVIGRDLMAIKAVTFI